MNPEEMKALLEEIREAVGDLGNAISADLEMGSHYMNNAASAQFAKQHPRLLKQLNVLHKLVDKIPDPS
jgi:hypothetical protein